jgi:hypothetical protein
MMSEIPEEQSQLMHVVDKKQEQDYRKRTNAFYILTQGVHPDPNAPIPQTLALYYVRFPRERPEVVDVINQHCAQQHIPVFTEILIYVPIVPLLAVLTLTEETDNIKNFMAQHCGFTKIYIEEIPNSQISITRALNFECTTLAECFPLLNLGCVMTYIEYIKNLQENDLSCVLQDLGHQLTYRSKGQVQCHLDGSNRSWLIQIAICAGILKPTPCIELTWDNLMMKIQRSIHDFYSPQEIMAWEHSAKQYKPEITTSPRRVHEKLTSLRKQMNYTDRLLRSIPSEKPEHMIKGDTGLRLYKRSGTNS